MSEVKIFGYNFFDLFDKTSSNILLPAGGMGIAIFVGWVLGPKAIDEILGDEYSPFMKSLFLWSVRILAPAGVIGIFANSLIG